VPGKSRLHRQEKVVSRNSRKRRRSRHTSR
jgi:hypothetical protein